MTHHLHGHPSVFLALHGRVAVHHDREALVMGHPLSPCSLGSCGPHQVFWTSGQVSSAYEPLHWKGHGLARPPAGWRCYWLWPYQGYPGTSAEASCMLAAQMNEVEGVLW